MSDMPPISDEENERRQAAARAALTGGSKRANQSPIGSPSVVQPSKQSRANAPAGVVGAGRDFAFGRDLRLCRFSDGKREDAHDDGVAARCASILNAPPPFEALCSTQFLSLKWHFIGWDAP